MVRTTTYNSVQVVTQRLESTPIDQVCDNLAEIFDDLMKQSSQTFAKKAESLIIEDSSWGNKVQAHIVDLNQYLQTLVESCKSKLLTNFSQSTQQAQEAKLRDMIGDLMHDTTEGLCKRFEASYT